MREKNNKSKTIGAVAGKLVNIYTTYILIVFFLGCMIVLKILYAVGRLVYG